MRVVSLEKVVELLRKNKVPKVGELHRILTQMSFDLPKNSEKSQDVDMTNVWYEVPHFVWFYNLEGKQKSGLVAHDILVELLSGRVYTCQEILQNGRDMGKDLDDVIIEVGDWGEFWKNLVFYFSYL